MDDAAKLNNRLEIIDDLFMYFTVRLDRVHGRRPDDTAQINSLRRRLWALRVDHEVAVL